MVRIVDEKCKFSVYVDGWELIDFFRKYFGSEAMQLRIIVYLQS